MEVQDRPETLPPELQRVADASLKELGDIRIDDVMEFLDRGLDNMPSYMDLYRRWEKQQWAVSDLDFTPDREMWLTLTPPEQKSLLWSRRLFFNGEERVTATLAPLVWAAPTPEVEIFLSTQMVDEARHTVFFERWWREVVGTEARDMRSLLDQVRPHVSPGYDEIFYTNLPELAQHLSVHPDDRDAFVKFITLYHLVIEGALALTGQRFALEGMRELGVTHHGFYRGFTAVARDESRHVNFGVKFLQEAVHEDARRFAPLIQQTLVESLPLIQTTLEPPEEIGVEYLRMREYSVEEDEILQFAMQSLTKRLRAIGINLAA